MNSETTIAASNGDQIPAVQLFSFALRYFKEHALKELSAQSATIIVNEDVRWVITVPAIWRAPAKQLMRQAAYEVHRGLHYVTTIYRGLSKVKAKFHYAIWLIGTGQRAVILCGWGGNCRPGGK